MDGARPGLVPDPGCLDGGRLGGQLGKHEAACAAG